MITREFFYIKENGTLKTMQLTSEQQVIIRSVEKNFNKTPKIAAYLFLQETGFYNHKEVLNFIKDESISVYQIFCNHIQNNYQNILDVVEVFKRHFDTKQVGC